MIRIDIDQRIVEREDACDQLRRKVYEARIQQAKEEGRREGFEEGFEAGMVTGRKLERERHARIYAAYEKGDIS